MMLLSYNKITDACKVILAFKHQLVIIKIERNVFNILWQS
jgi:hypothetical protein